MKFAVYSKDGCPYCVKIQKVLELAKLEHIIYKLNSDFTREQFYDRFGQGSTFPQVVCDQTQVGGCSDTIKFLQEKNLV